ncbi:hypothetical protein CS022_14780 [Veronia nyctiphanis]|uniref:histidine kinase n=1 Tax=Veronia nyctiphanis TaxID=1278244 RepID=A0A4Q0YLX6_9GAMM|nr:HAMP domain-containing sensor histidine kinase [Veronia nyctiphanis]RXJ71822.1 hypothetical protein CS022_19325 [Veronia nyctiphanis]RXJ72573.1 hypothetical protein CS022_14780 [Veronia nyctiphanis]
MRTFFLQITLSVLLGFIFAKAVSEAYLTLWVEEFSPDTPSICKPGVLNSAEEISYSCKDGETCSDSFICLIDTDVEKISAYPPMQGFSDGGTPVAMKLEKDDPYVFVSRAYAFRIWTVDLLLQLGCTLLVMGGILFSWSRGLGRLEELSSALSCGDLRRRVRLHGPEPVKSLIANQHAMADSILRLQRKKKLIFGSLPHDIRTPLAAIQLTTDILSQHEGDSKFLRNKLSGQVSNLNLICESSLHLYKILNNEVELHKEQFTFESVLIDSLALIPEDKCYRFVNCNQTLISDKKLVTILLQNSLSNAFRYTKSCVDVSFKSYPHHDVIRINDDGPGFPDDVVATFRNKDTSLIKNADGFGIGLVLIYELTMLLSGQVVISNTEAGGEVLVVINK